MKFQGKGGSIFDWVEETNLFVCNVADLRSE